MNTRFLRSGVFTLILVVGIAAILYMFIFDTPKSVPIPYSGGSDAFLSRVAAGKVDKVVQQGNKLVVTLKELDSALGKPKIVESHKSLLNILQIFYKSLLNILYL